jgi:hypothetical protein
MSRNRAAYLPDCAPSSARNTPLQSLCEEAATIVQQRKMQQEQAGENDLSTRRADKSFPGKSETGVKRNTVQITAEEMFSPPLSLKQA